MLTLLRDNVGQPEFVFWFHNSTMINFQPGVTVETALIGSQSHLSLSLFSPKIFAFLLGSTTSKQMFPRCWFVALRERPPLLNWISALVTSLWHFKCCIVHNKGLKGWSLGWCWWCLHQVNYLLYLYLGRSLAWGLSSYYLSLQVQTLLPYGLPLPTPLCQGSNQIHKGGRKKSLGFD